MPNTRTYYDLEHLWADGEPMDISEYLTPDSSLNSSMWSNLSVKGRRLRQLRSARLAGRCINNDSDPTGVVLLLPNEGEFRKVWS